ncbi:DUF2207 domain-containing protein [Lactobacillus johnsonii]|uniref:DUF2207 domain-containing protein n=1 Tax=Lactobacillus johnsonii TaxID=33959 RepID=A0A9X0J704_LACJH|nr:DUF2207 domain-containing protein [Lactobacillus johnsonii]KXN76088.1 hypothetical protein AYJ53_08700 [Lactobacillus johnsonii]
MKKIFYVITEIILFLISVIAFTKPVLADVNYEITNVDVTARVNSNGSLSMERRITYKFDDDAHGIFYQQNLTNNQELKNPQVRILADKNSQLVVPSTSHENNTYELSHSDHGYRFKVWHSVRDGDKFTVIYTYEITNAITNWKDTAELNFKIIGNGWDTDLDNVRVGIFFPGPVKDLKAWAHGDLSGQITVNPQKGNIIMTASNVGGDEGIEVHSLFPVEVTNKNKNVKDQDHKKYVLDQEARFARQANERRQKSKILGIGALVISGLLSLLAIIRSFTLKKSGVKPEKEKQLARNYEIPSVSPVMAEILDTGDEPSSRSLTASLMELAVQKKIKIDPIKIRKRTYYEISLIDENIMPNNPLLNYLFDKVGDGQSFTTYELKKHHSSKLGKKFNKWQEQEMQKATGAGFFDEKLEHKQHANSILMVTLLILSGIAMFSAFFSNEENIALFICAAILLVLAILAVVYNKKKLSAYTARGAEVTNQVRGFKKMLDEIGNFKMRDIGELILWEEIMPYAVALGVSKKVLKQLKLEFADEIDDTNLLFWGAFYSDGKDGFASNFSSSFDSGANLNSSASGGSGGFSGGSSGGFGGGSGGGAF